MKAKIEHLINMYERFILVRVKRVIITESSGVAESDNLH